MSYSDGNACPKCGLYGGLHATHVCMTADEWRASTTTTAERSSPDVDSPVADVGVVEGAAGDVGSDGDFVAV